jgi:hypothetical protein
MKVFVSPAPHYTKKTLIMSGLFGGDRKKASGRTQRNKLTSGPCVSIWYNPHHEHLKDKKLFSAFQALEPDGHTDTFSHRIGHCITLPWHCEMVDRPHIRHFLSSHGKSAEHMGRRTLRSG